MRRKAVQTIHVRDAPTADEVRVVPLISQTMDVVNHQTIKPRDTQLADQLRQLRAINRRMGW